MTFVYIIFWTLLSGVSLVLGDVSLDTLYIGTSIIIAAEYIVEGLKDK